MCFALPELTLIENWFSSWLNMENAAPWFGVSPMRGSGRSRSNNRRRKCERRRSSPHKLIEEATTDAYNESEQAGGFFAMIEENLSLTFVTQVLGQAVTVAKVDITRRDQIVAICAHGKSTQAIPILDLPMPDPPPEGAEWIDAYRRWYGN
jgi:hypothetical protein